MTALMAVFWSVSSTTFCSANSRCSYCSAQARAASAGLAKFGSAGCTG